MFLNRPWHKRAIPACPRNSASGGGGAKRESSVRKQRSNGAMKRAKNLTIADLVLLSLLAERPMHGYQANAELARREVQNWAGISRPQVYYSLQKLSRLGFLAERPMHGYQANAELARRE